MRELVFPPVVSDIHKSTKEQLDSIDALIDNMDLQAVKFVHFFKYLGILLLFANKYVSCCWFGSWLLMDFYTVSIEFSPCVPAEVPKYVVLSITC
jgi:hypothetical protein